MKQKLQIPVKKNEEYEIEIVDLGNDGEGVGKIEGFPVFVPGGLPGELLRVKIVKVKTAFAFGKLLACLKAADRREAPPCPYFGRCGGCDLSHMNYKSQLAYKTKKVAEQLRRIGHFTDTEVLPAIGMEEPFYYRNKMQFPVGRLENKLVSGFYAKRSHVLVPVENCLIQQKAGNTCIEMVQRFLEEYAVSAYDEQTHMGLVRHIMVRTGSATGEIMVCIVINGRRFPNAAVLVERLQKLPGIASIILNHNKEKTNVILGRENTVLWGKKTITDKVGSLSFQISPHSFFQVNPVQTKVLYEKVLSAAELTGQETVLDVYCGIGTISLFLAKMAKQVVGIEVVPEAVEDAEENSRHNEIENVSFLAGKAETLLARLHEEQKLKPDVIVLDPPRKGCGRQVLAAMIAMHPKKIVYVSCDPATLARDLRILADGGYQLKMVQPVDMFPQTANVETVALLSHKDSVSKTDTE